MLVHTDFGRDLARASSPPQGSSYEVAGRLSTSSSSRHGRWTHEPASQRARSPASAGRTARCSPSSCSTRGTRWPASSAATPAAYAEALAPLEGRVELVAGRPARPGVARSRASCDAAPTEVYNLASPSFVPALVGRAGADGRVRRRRRDLDARGDPRGRSRDPLLPGVVERDLRRAARDAADGGDAAAPVTPVRRREGVRALHRAQLPAPLRDVHVLRDPLQPRVAAAAGRLPAAQGRARRGGDLARAGGGARARRPRCAPRLGLRGRLRARDVADAPARRARRLHRRDRRLAKRRGARRLRVRRVSGSTGASTCAPTRRSFAARPSSTTSSATPRRPRTVLGWEPAVPFEELVELLVEAELGASARQDASASS